MTNPVEYQGVIYKSQKALAKHLGCDPSTIHHQLAKYGYVGEIKKHRRLNNAHPVKFRGMEFESITAFAIYLGKSESYINELWRKAKIEKLDKFFKEVNRDNQPKAIIRSKTHYPNGEPEKDTHCT